MEMDSKRLPELAQSASPEHQVVRIAYSNHPSVMIRSNGVRCVMTPRVERQRGLLQLIIATRVVWGGRQILPRDVTAKCDNAPLRCLTLPETLELLYGHLDCKVRKNDEEKLSFAAVSERDDYLIPSNFRRLQENLDKANRAYANMPRPALVDLPGVDYPGPAILGDSRALGQFLQQREYMQPDDSEKVGWVIFAGEGLRKGNQVEVSIDLGDGTVPVTFTIPK